MGISDRMYKPNDGGPLFCSGSSTVAQPVAIAPGATYSSTKPSVDTGNLRTITVQLCATGVNTASNGRVTAYFTGHLKNGAQWDTEPFASLPVTMVGGTAVASSGVIDCADYDSVRVERIINEDATYTASQVNLYYSKKRVTDGYYPK